MHEPRRQLSYEDYVRESPRWDVKHEWVNGVAYAMAGGSPHHNAVTLNVAIALGALLRGRPCRPTSPDQRVHVETTGASLYPDVIVVCGPFEYASTDPDAVTNPTVVVEVLSPSTRDYDQGAKFGHYRRLESLQDVLFVDPLTRHVIHHTRHAEGWLRRDIEAGVVTLRSLDVELPLDEIYADLEALGEPRDGEGAEAG
jgi:Uma2 family endonuclease